MRRIILISCFIMLTLVNFSLCPADVIKKQHNTFNESTLQEFNILHKLVDENNKENTYQLLANEEITFTPPYDDELKDTAGYFDPADWDKWDAGSTVDKSTGDCVVWSTCAGAEAEGWMVSFSGVCGRFEANEDLWGVELNLYCIANFMIWCGSGFDGFSEFKIMYILYEDGEIASEEVLKTYKRRAGGSEYSEDFRSDPITTNIANIDAGKNYEIWIWAWARTSSKGGGSSSYVDVGLGSNNRYFKVNKIKITGGLATGWLEIEPSSYRYGAICEGDLKDYTFKVKNTGDYPVRNINSKILWGTDNFRVIEGNTKEYLAAGSSYNVVIRFEPEYQGEDISGELISQGDHSNVARSLLYGTCDKSRCFSSNTRFNLLMQFQNIYPIFQLIIKMK